MALRKRKKRRIGLWRTRMTSHNQSLRSAPELQRGLQRIRLCLSQRSARRCQGIRTTALLGGHSQWGRNCCFRSQRDHSRFGEGRRRRPPPLILTLRRRRRRWWKITSYSITSANPDTRTLIDEKRLGTRSPASPIVRSQNYSDGFQPRGWETRESELLLYAAAHCTPHQQRKEVQFRKRPSGKGNTAGQWWIQNRTPSRPFREIDEPAALEEATCHPCHSSNLGGLRGSIPGHLR